ncbi:MAG: hypothetical protein LBG60_00520 [Bifidobacteriaceae bacterium]|jgi:hypothetical protein|nr:hypothetical protein [Bifidobacteriaceae bacterium]
MRSRIAAEFRKTGVARLALVTGAPVIPISMVGTNLAQPVGKRLPKLMRVGIVVGRPIDLSKYQGLGEDRFVLREVTDQIMFEIMKLSGQDYVDVYAATMKARLASGAPAPDSETPDSAPGGRLRPPGLEPPAPPEPDEAARPDEAPTPADAPAPGEPASAQPAPGQPGPGRARAPWPSRRPGADRSDQAAQPPPQPGPPQPGALQPAEPGREEEPPGRRRWFRGGAGRPPTASDTSE